MSENLLEVRKLSKSFGVTHANIDIDMTLARGEVRGLAGENGSGKSTLLSQIAGITQSDSGMMLLNGEPYKPENSIDAGNRGVAIVVQELGLVSALPAGVNVFLGKAGVFVNLKKLQKDADAISDRWELPRINLKPLAGSMNVEQRKMVELIRALSSDPQILILDEVTQSLSQDNRNLIYKLLKKFKSENRSVIMISHDLEELMAITDTISVLRDGRLIETVESRNLTENDLKHKMVGRDIKGDYYRTDQEEQHKTDVLMSFNQVTAGDSVKNVSFELHKGEILAFCGLSDSGIHDIGKIAYGLIRPSEGKVVYDGKEIRNPIESLKNNMAYVPKDRDGEALMMHTSIMNNIVLPYIEEEAGKVGYLDYTRLEEVAKKCRKEFSIKCTGIKQNVSSLSGGNKQKINLGRWMTKDLKVLIVDCPTRGVDVGVKAYIYQSLRDAKEKEIGIIMITDELPEAMGMADNIVVMRNGEVRKIISRSSHFSDEEIIEVMV